MKDGVQLTKTDVKILRFLLDNITKEFSMNKISESVKVAYPSARKRILELNRRSLVSIKEINTTQSMCKLNIKNGNNINVFSYLEFLVKDDIFQRKTELKTITDDILNAIPENSFSMIVFGSHAKSKETVSSDIDILFLIQSTKEETRIMSAVSTAEKLTNRKIHAISMTYDDFFDSLKKGSASLPKEVLENHVIVYGAEAFYRSLVVYG